MHTFPSFQRKVKNNGFVLDLKTGHRNGLDKYTNSIQILEQSAKREYEEFVVLFGSVLWHINHCGLFNAKCCLYTY